MFSNFVSPLIEGDSYKGFAISASACIQYYKNNNRISDDIKAEINEFIDKMELATGKKFGDEENPLLVSVACHTPVVVPGLLKEFSFLGINDETVEAIGTELNNLNFAYSCYCDFIQYFSDEVMAINPKYFEDIADKAKKERNVSQNVELPANDLKELVFLFKSKYKAMMGSDFPYEPRIQLMYVIESAFRSWDNPRSNVYRKYNNIPFETGLSVEVRIVCPKAYLSNQKCDSNHNGEENSFSKKHIDKTIICEQGEEVSIDKNNFETTKPLTNVPEQSNVESDFVEFNPEDIDF